jgi:hypothetical protein
MKVHNNYSKQMNKRATFAPDIVSVQDSETVPLSRLNNQLHDIQDPNFSLSKLRGRNNRL